MVSRKKSVGRLARSVEIITQRPTIGSFLKSGTYEILSMGGAEFSNLRGPSLNGTSRLDGLIGQRRILKNFDVRGRRQTVIVYADYIEPPLARWWRSPQVFPG